MQNRYILVDHLFSCYAYRARDTGHTAYQKCFHIRVQLKFSTRIT